MLELIRVAADLQGFCEARTALKEAPEILTELARRRAEFEQ